MAASASAPDSNQELGRNDPSPGCTCTCLFVPQFPVLLALAVELYVLLSGAVQGHGLAALPLAALQSRRGKDAAPWGPGSGTVQRLLYDFSWGTSSFPLGV